MPINSNRLIFGSDVICKLHYSNNKFDPYLLIIARGFYRTKAHVRVEGRNRAKLFLAEGQVLAEGCDRAKDREEAESHVLLEGHNQRIQVPHHYNR